MSSGFLDWFSPLWVVFIFYTQSFLFLERLSTLKRMDVFFLSLSVYLFPYFLPHSSVTLRPFFFWITLKTVDNGPSFFFYIFFDYTIFLQHILFFML